MKALFRNLPETPGVYLMRGARGKLLYVGKAANLRCRVASYFARPGDARIEQLVHQIRRVDFRRTDTALEALILEADFIKRYQPPFNVREKDDRSFLYVEITKEDFPRVLLVRGKSNRLGKPARRPPAARPPARQGEAGRGRRFGPFPSALSIREALRVVRKIFPWSTHNPSKIGTAARPCFDYEIGLCPGTCIGAVTREEYLKNIRNVRRIFQGKRRETIRLLTREMRRAAGKLDFERAAKLRRQVFALQHIQDVALLGDSSAAVSPGLRPPKADFGGVGEKGARIEGYDISNISGTSAVGAMVVFENGSPQKNAYRKFRIRTFERQNDTGMIEEVLRRRLRHAEWPLPELILVDGGTAQVRTAERVVAEACFRLPVVGIAKGPERKKNEFVGKIPEGFCRETLICVRDEAHRFAISYHRSVRGKTSLATREMLH